MMAISGTARPTSHYRPLPRPSPARSGMAIRFLASSARPADLGRATRTSVAMVERANPKVFRCAIYTRKSSEEGLEQDFNSLQAQREACEAYIASQKHEGWKALPKPYDDGGYSGGSMER